MRGWYLSYDALGIDGEVVVPETSTFAETLTLIMAATGNSAATRTGPG